MYRFSAPLALILLLLQPLNLSAAEGVLLGDLTWPEAEREFAERPLVIIPFGAGFKEHGPHIPMNADAVVMQYLVDQAVEHKNVLVAPPVLHGWLPAFRDYPGSEVADATVFINYMTSVSEALIRSGAQRILYLNLSIGKASGLPLGIVAREMRVQHGVPTLLVNWEDMETEEFAEFTEQAAGGHGDEIETSINLFLQGDKVQMDKAVKDERLDTLKNYPGYRPGLFSRNPNDPTYSETGIFGDATKASAEKGERAMGIMVQQLFLAIDGFSQEPLVQNRQ